jgi:iron complex outermembrane recepter protein
MSYKNKLVLTGAILVSVGQLASSAVAADNTAPETSANTSGPQLDEIVITAQKRTEKLADVPVAASVVSADALASMNAGDISDLNKMVPSLDLVGSFNGRVPLGIRGISSNANEATVGLASGVAYMIDGIPIPSDADAANQLEDVKDIEVLKGPQATLGGRTAAAGIINIVTRGPTDQLTGNVSVTATNDHEYRFNGFVGGPVAENVLGSLSVYGTERQFPINNIYYGQNSDQDNTGVRGKLLFKPNEDLDITLMGAYQKSKSEGPNFVYTYVTPGAYLLLGLPSSPGFPPLPPPILSTLSQAAVLAGVKPSNTNETANTPVTESSDITDQMFSVNVDYRIGGLTLSSTTAYLRETQFNYQDLFVNSSYYSNNFRDAFAAIIGPIPGTPGSWATFYNEQTQDILVNQTSQEFRVASSPDEPFNYVAGLFYSDQTVDMVATRTLTPAATNYNVDTDTKTYDIYGRSTWKFLPTTSLITGIRYNHDELSYTYQQGTPGDIYTSNSDNSNAVVGDISLQQQLAPNSMAYFTYARGYAPKVFNTGAYSGGNAAAPAAAWPATGQEHIDHFEIGSKGTYLDNRLQVNSSAFYTVYKNYQVQTSESIPGQVAPILGLTPAGKARTEGLEVDSTLAATQSLRIGLDLAYIDAKFIDYSGAPCWGNGVTQTAALGCHPVLGPNGQPTGSYAQDVSGDTMPDSPRFKGTLYAEQRLPLGGSNYEGVIGGNYAYRTRTQFQPDQNPETIQGSFGLLNLSLGIRERTGKYSITAFCNNVTDHHYYVDMEDFWSGPWGSNAVVGQPARDANRYFGIRLQAGL